MTPGSALTATDLIAAASQILAESGYRRIADIDEAGFPGAKPRLYEDPYSVVAVVVYETWAELELRWTDAQGALVELMSAHMTSEDPKSWEGYLVLLTPSLVGGFDDSHSQAVSAIRYDTSRVRKLVATGDDLEQLSDIERTLLPLLPLRASQPGGSQDRVLEMLPELLHTRSGIDEKVTERVITAFQEQRSLLEAVDDYRRSA